MRITLSSAVAALLPAVALAQSLEAFTLTINGQVTVVDLPPFSNAPAPSPTVITAVTTTPVATVVTTIGSAAPAAPPPPASYTGETIPITINGYITSVVLPYWASQPVPTAPVTVSQSVLSVNVPIAGSSVVSSASSAIASGILFSVLHISRWNRILTMHL